MKDRSLLTIIVVSLIALAILLSGVVLFKDLGGLARAILALVTTIVIGVAGIGKVLAGKSKR